MVGYKHISEMENILDEYTEHLKHLEEELTFLETHAEAFDKLMTYYYSEQRQADLLDDARGIIDQSLKRGVLSEDTIYDLLADYYSDCVRMLELSTAFFKKH